MYDKIENGSSVNIQGLECHLPPEGYVYNIITKQVEFRGVYERSEIKEEQYWERIPLPYWYKDVMRAWDNYEKKKKEDDPDFYDERLEEYKQQEWDRRLNGFWWRNNGEAVYIVGSHYFYMQHWSIDIGYPKYREPDLEYFYFLQYVIEDPNCMGMLEITKRRFGKTYRGGLFVSDYVTRTKMTNGTIQSKTGSDAKKVFAKAIVNPFRKLPRFFRPEYDMSLGVNPKTEMRFQKTNVRGKKAEENIDKEELGSVIDWHSADPLAQDGMKVHRAFQDEWAKTTECDIYERHEVMRYCVVDDEGKIIGKLLYSSTVEKLDSDKDGVQEGAKKLWEDSDQNNKNPNGRTASGLYRFFMTADKARNFDIYGKPNIEKTIAEIMADRATVAHNSKSLAARIRKEARTIQEAFMIDGDQCLFDTMKLTNQLDWLSYHKDMVEKGNLVWEDGHEYYREYVYPNGEIENKIGKLRWVPHPNGEYEKVVGWEPKEKNNVYIKNGYFVPNASYLIRIGCDPFKYDKTKDNRKSNCAAYAFQLEDPMDDKNPYGEMFVMRYVGRPATTDKQYNAVLKMGWYCGCQILFERNVDGAKKYFTVEKCANFLMWLPNEVEFGVYTDGNGKAVQAICDLTESYIDKNIEKVYFPELISMETGWLGFKVEDTQKYDDVMGAGIAMIAAKNKKFSLPTNHKRDINSVMPYKKAI